MAFTRTTAFALVAPEAALNATMPPLVQSVTLATSSTMAPAVLAQATVLLAPTALAAQLVPQTRLTTLS
jgi:hypothetical protein